MFQIVIDYYCLFLLLCIGLGFEVWGVSTYMKANLLDQLVQDGWFDFEHRLQIETLYFSKHSIS